MSKLSATTLLLGVMLVPEFVESKITGTQY